MKYGIDSSALKSRCEARKAAEAVLELLTELVAGNSEHYWKIIREFAQKQVPSTVGVEVSPMSDKEARLFGETLMPYGKYSRVAVESVPVQYLDWLVGEKDDFKDQLKRYVQNDVVRRRFQDELED